MAEKEKGVLRKFRDAFRWNNFTQPFDNHSIKSDPTNNPIKLLGRGTYNLFNGFGSGVSGICNTAGGVADSITEATKKPLEFCRQSFADSPSFSRKVGWGVLTAAATALRAVGSVVEIAGATTKTFGKLVHETSILVGATARGITHPLNPDSYKIFGSALTRVGSEAIMTITSPIKQFGTEVKSIANEARIPIATQGLRLAGSSFQSLAQMTEGAVQGVRKMLVGDFLKGAELIRSGAQSAGKTMLDDVKSIAGDAIRDISGEKRHHKQETAQPAYSREFHTKVEEARSSAKFYTQKDQKEVKGPHTKRLKEERQPHSQKNEIGK